jgi:hypothetical protein
MISLFETLKIKLELEAKQKEILYMIAIKITIINPVRLGLIFSP